MSTGFEEFDDTVQKTNQLLKQIETSFGWENRRNQSYAALRAVLHALRDRLTVNESAQLAAQLPMLVKGIYYQGWDPAKVPKRMDREEFLQEIRREFPYSLAGEPEDLVEVVLAALSKFVSIGEAEDVMSVLPKDLKKLVGEIVKTESQL